MACKNTIHGEVCIEYIFKNATAVILGGKKLLNENFNEFGSGEKSLVVFDICVVWNATS